MLDSIPILTLITFSPLIGVLVLLFIPKDKGKWIKIIAICATLIPLLLSAWLFVDFDYHKEGMQYTEEVEWIKIPLNQDAGELQRFSDFYYIFKYHMGVDGLSLPLVFLTALITTMAALASVVIKKRWKTFYILFLLLEVGMFGVFLAKDLFLFFLFFEITLVPMFFLVGIWGYKDREKAANKFLIYNGIGSAIMLIAFLIIVNTAGFNINELPDQQVEMVYSGDIHVIEQNLTNPDAYANIGEDRFPGNPFYMSDVMKWTLFLMLIIAFGIKLPLFPFHTWMLKVHTEAPPSIVMIHSGILLKMGAYGLIRFGISFFPEQAKEWALVLAIIGIINILYGAVLAIVQKDLKLVLAYSSISHMGIVILGIVAFNHIGLQGAIFQLVSHGLISALMFLIVSMIYERTSTTTLEQLGGLAKPAPFLCGIFLVAGMASLGLPGLSGFISELLAFLGVFDTMPVIAVIGVLGILLTAVYVLRAVLKITFGQTREEFNEIKDARLVEVVPMVSLVAFILLIGVYPAVLSEPLQQTIQSIVMKLGG